MNEEIRESDRELLELAAKAAGYGISGWDDMMDNCLYVSDPSTPSRRPFAWLPLTDDGDAFRLAVKCGIEFQFSAGATWVELGTGPSSVHLHHEPHNGDPYAATRRAIVRAAAEIGRNMV
jgi:hypothetical protein